MSEKIEVIKSFIEIFATIIGVVGVIFTIHFGFSQINLTLTEQRLSNRLELADDLMSEYMTLSSYASKTVFYIAAEANGEADTLIKMDSNYPNYMQMHSEELETIKSKIAAYGSTELVSLFFDSYNDVHLKLKNGETDFESYKDYFYSMPLIASYIKYDLTGEVINPSIFYDSFMSEIKLLEEVGGMEDYHEKMIAKNNELVEKYNLSKKFIWEETIR